jgi:hypothetical protein
MAHARCAAHGESDIERACLPLKHNFISRHPIWNDDDCLDPSPLSRANLGLLQTCRQIYTEAVDLLYSENTFDFATAESFNSFAKTVLPRRLAVTTALDMGFFHIFDLTPMLIRGPL